LYLGLTDFQLEQLVQIMNEQNEALMENYRQIAQKEAELYNLFNSGTQDLHRIGRLTVDIHMRIQPPANNYRERALAVLTHRLTIKAAGAGAGLDHESYGASGR
jgi:hypothetical protein